MFKKRHLRFNPRRLWLFDGESDPADGGKGKTGNSDPGEGNPDPKAKTPEPKTDDRDKDKAERERIAAENKELKKKLSGYEAEQKKRDDANKTAEEKLREVEKERDNEKKQNLIERTRRAHGFTGKVYDHFTPKGETEDELKASYEAFKADLDEAYKDERKPAAGGGTTPPKGKDPEPKPKSVSLLQQKFPNHFGNSAHS